MVRAALGLAAVEVLVVPSAEVDDAEVIGDVEEATPKKSTMAHSPIMRKAPWMTAKLLKAELRA